MKINRAKFYTNYREKFGKLTQVKVDNLNFLLSKLEAGLFKLPTQMAYMLGTIELETAYSYAPVVEGFYMEVGNEQRLRSLYSYYRNHNPSALKTIFPNVIKDDTGRVTDFGLTYEGRGYCQCTHNFNYAKYGIEDTPEKALEPETAYHIIEHGMANGMFTGKKLQDYINETKTSYKNARRVINGLNEWEKIANFAKQFEQGIELVSDELAMQGYNQEEVLT